MIKHCLAIILYYDFIGNRAHDTAVFVKKNGVRYQFLQYNSYPIKRMRIMESFIRQFKTKEASKYSEGIHGQINDNNTCAPLSWLEVYLSIKT